MTMMKSTGKGDEEGIGSLRPSSNTTVVLGSVRGDEDPSAASNKHNVGRLRKMVYDLEKMDAAWRGALTSQPSTVEQILYMLILGRVTSDIFLFHREKNARLRALPEGGVGFIVKELSDKGSVFGITLTDNDLDISGGEQEDEDIPSDNANDELVCSWLQLSPLREIVENVRNSISQWPSAEKFEAGQSAEIEIVGEETRVETLRQILCGLAERRRERSYAPPEDEVELTCYREIRKWGISTITFIGGKTCWMREWERHLRSVGEAEYQNCPLVERVRISRGKWRGFSGGASTLQVKFPTPEGHLIAVAFDELPEIWSLLSRWRRRFLDITMRFLKGEGIDVVGSTYGGVKVEFARGKRARVRQELEGQVKKKKNGKNSPRIVDGMSGQSWKPRAQYIVDMLSISLSMDTKSCLSSREVRLYARILEHVSSSIWLFNERATPREMHVYNTLCREKGTVPETVPWSGDREESLQEIVRLVDEIESKFLCSTPTGKEAILYAKLEKHMNVDLMEPRCSQQLAGIEHHHAYQIGSCLLKETGDMEIELARQLMKEFGDALRTIFPEVPHEINAASWIEEHQENAANMLKELVTDTPLGLQYLDHLLLSLCEGTSLLSHIAEMLTDGNSRVYTAMFGEKQYQTPIHDCWAALGVAEASGFVKDGDDNKS